jgi:hypothetical protein
MSQSLPRVAVVLLVALMLPAAPRAASRSASPGYEASVYFGYDDHAHDYIAHWLEQFGAAGARVVATGRRDGQTLVLAFPYPEGALRDALELAADGNSGSLLLESQDEGRQLDDLRLLPHEARAPRTRHAAAAAAPGRTRG